MNNELVIKLAKLANNNPNENESNLAARKVCRMLAEDEFKCLGAVVSPPRNATRQQPSYHEYSSTWTGFGGYGGFNQFYEDYFRRTGESRKYGDWSTPKEDHKEPEPKPSDYIKWNPYDKGEIKSDKPKRPLKCKKCGNIVMTAFVGPEVIFKCFTCQFDK